jgi:NTE family protein
LNLALQGGGSHGAFTWGVLDALLEADRFTLRVVTGASAGALNAAVLATGLARERAGAPPGTAREALRAFWRGLSQHAAPPWFNAGTATSPRLSPWGQFWLASTQWLAPAQFNPLDHNPLRELLHQHVDITALRRPGGVGLRVATTRADRAQLRLFTEQDLSIDALLASACLPQFHHPVGLDGALHWDGGLAANPPLLPLLHADGAARDTLLVTLLPLQWPDVPTQAAAIRQRLLELAFHRPLMAELEALQHLQASTRGLWAGLFPPRVARLRWHAVDGGQALLQLARESRLFAQPAFLEHLFDQGRSAGQRWLGGAAADVGRRSSRSVDALLAPEPPTR